MLHINRHFLHVLLVDFELDESSNSKFFKEELSFLRTIIKAQSGNGYKYDDLSQEEMYQLIGAIRIYIDKNKLCDNSVDNLMLHHMMCEYLLQYELDYPSTDLTDEFKLVIEEYFLKINQELELISAEILNESNYKSLLIWLELLTNNPGKYLNHQWVGGNGNDYTLKYLNLMECGCIDVSHDRVFGKVRLNIERLVLEACENRFLSKEIPLKLLSMGPGGGLQDFIIIYKLLNKGIRNIELTLVDPEYKLLAPIPDYTRKIYCRGLPEGSPLPERYYQSYQKGIYNIIRSISLLNRRFEDANICIYQYHSIANIKNDVEVVAPYDLVYAIDFEDYANENARKDFHETANYLKNDGLSFLSTHNQIMIFNVQQNQNGNEYNEVDKIQHDPIKSEEDGYHPLNNVSNFFS